MSWTGGSQPFLRLSLGRRRHLLALDWVSASCPRSAPGRKRMMSCPSSAGGSSASSSIMTSRIARAAASTDGLTIRLDNNFNCGRLGEGRRQNNNIQPWPRRSYHSSSSLAGIYNIYSALPNATSIRSRSTTSIPDIKYSMLEEKNLPIHQWKLHGSGMNFGKQKQATLTTERLFSQSSHCLSNEKEKHNTNMGNVNGSKAGTILSATTQQDNISSPHANRPPKESGGSDSESDRAKPDIINITQQQPSEPSMHNISYLPASLHPYAHLARLDKPIGTMLLLHPCLWSTALAATPPTTLEVGSTLTTMPDLSLCALFGLGSFIMRGAGCTINDMWDSQYDKSVERTKSRPLASGDLSYSQAWKFLALQLSAGLGVLVSLPHLEECFFWGVASLPLVATYPLMKRYTDYPQLALGMTFNWGAIMGWVAVRGEVDWAVVGPLYASGVAWTLVYDTLYAHQDKKDDAKLGLKSTALTFGERGTKPILSALAGVTWGGWMMAGYNCGFGDVLDAPYYYAGVSAAASHLLWQIYSADLNDSENLAYRFRSNNLVGWMVFGSCVAGNAMAC